MSKYLDKKNEEKEVARHMKKIRGLNTLMIIIIICLVLLFGLVYLSKYFM